jgi:hypothetical protein
VEDHEAQVTEERELKIRATADADQAIAETEKLKGAVEGVSTAQTEGTASTTAAKEATVAEAVAAGEAAEALTRKRIAEAEASVASKQHAVDTAEVSTALSNARTAMSAFVLDYATGGKTLTETSAAASAAVNALSAAIKTARAADSPVTKDAVKTEENFRDAIKAAAVDLGTHSTATTKASDAMRFFRAEGQASIPFLGTFGRAVTTLAGDTNSWVGALARAALPVAALLGAAVALDKGLKGLRDRGVDVGTMADVTGSIMDQLAVAFGGTTKAGAEMEKAFLAAQKSIEGLTVAERDYLTSSDLFAASGLDTAAVFKAMADTVPAVNRELGHMSQEFSEMPTPIEAARSELDKLNEQINRMAKVDPAGARQLREELARLAAAGRLAASDLAPLREAAAFGEAAFQKFSDVLQNVYGKNVDEVSKISGTLGRETSALASKMEQLANAGLNEGAIYDKLSAQIKKVALSSAEYAAAVEQLPSKLRAWITEVQRLEAEHGGLTVFLAKNHEQLLKNIGAFNEIARAVDTGTARFGDHKAAVSAVSTAIDGLIKDLEKQRDTEGQLGLSQQAMLDGLLRWNAEIGKSSPALTSASKDLEAYTKKITDLGFAIEKNRKEFEQHIKKIEEDRLASIAASDAVVAKLIVNSAIEVKTLNSQLAAQTISQTEYNTSVNRLFAEQAIAKAAAYEQERAINEKAKQDRDELVAKDTEAKNRLKENLDAANAGYAAAVTAREGFIKQQKEMVSGLQKEQEIQALAPAKIDAHAKSQREFTADIKEVVTHTSKANDALTLHLTHHGTLQSPEKGVPATTKRVSELGTQFGVTAGEVPALNGAIDGLIGKMQALQAAAASAALAVASVTDGPGTIPGAETSSTGLA